jgi:hypothetical protein
MRRAFVVITLLILITLLSIIQSIQVTKANSIPLPPNFRVESPQNNTVIYGADSSNISLTLGTGLAYDYYYSVDMQIIKESTIGKIPVNLTITSVKNPTTDYTNKTGQCNIHLHNLTDGQHSVTLYYSYYDSIISDWRHFLPVTTIVFSIASLVTPNPKPSPTVPEFSWLTILPLFVAISLIATITTRNRNLEARKA